MAHIKQTERNSKIYEQYLNGKSQVQIAADYGLSQARIHQIILRLRCQKEAAEGRRNSASVKLWRSVNRVIKLAKKAESLQKT